jgi:hypothetical protein
VELDLRNIKTTLGIEVLRCQTPPMIDKELYRRAKRFFGRAIFAGFQYPILEC